MKLSLISIIATAFALSFQGVAANAAPVPQDAAATAGSSDSWPSYVVLFEKGMETPDSIVKSLENKLKELGALITYEYNTVIKGFTVKAPKAVMEQVHTEEDSQYPFIIEEDKIVTIAGGN